MRASQSIPYVHWSDGCFVFTIKSVNLFLQIKSVYLNLSVCRRSCLHPQLERKLQCLIPNYNLWSVEVKTVEIRKSYVPIHIKGKKSYQHSWTLVSHSIAIVWESTMSVRFGHVEWDQRTDCRAINQTISFWMFYYRHDLADNYQDQRACPFSFSSPDIVPRTKLNLNTFM